MKIFFHKNFWVVDSNYNDSDDESQEGLEVGEYK